MSEELNEEERRFICIHEAGHAVVAMALGVNIEEIAVTKTNGHCIALFPNKYRSWQAAMYIAGGMATAVHFKGTETQSKWGNWKHDHEDWRLFNKYRGGMTFRQSRSITLDILKEEEAKLFKIARLLDQHDYLDYSNRYLLHD